jgi:hypothetical protein
MLSKAPTSKKQEPMEKEESQSSKLSSEEAADLKIASSILTQSFLSPEGESSLAQALSSPEPAKATAVLIAQLIEMTMTETANTDTPMSPTVWLMEDGAIDNAEEDIEKVAEANGIELPEGFEEAVIDEVAAVLMKRREDILAQQNGAGGQPPQQAPGGAAPAAPTMMGGMPNGMG